MLDTLLGEGRVGWVFAQPLRLTGAGVAVLSLSKLRLLLADRGLCGSARIALGFDTSPFRLSVSLVVSHDHACRFTFQVDAPCAGEHTLKVTIRAAIHRERANELGPSNGAAEHGEEVGVDANFEGPAARVRHGEALRKSCGQRGYNRLGSRAFFRHSYRPHVWIYLYYILRQSCDRFGDRRPVVPGRPDNSILIFTEP